VIEKRDDGLLLVAEPFEAAKEPCRRMAEVRVVGEEALFLEAYSAWAEPICAVLAAKGLRVKRLRRAGLEDGRTQAVPNERR
jgi:hypothetical protein